MTVPFVVLGLPRSRTAWLSKFLSYRDWSCGHEQLRYMRGLDDVKSWLSQDCVGTAETAVAPWWRLLLKYRPDVRIVLVRRDPDEVVKSLLALDVKSISAFDTASLERRMRRLDAKLDQIERRVPNVLSVSFDDLNEEQTCAKVFEHCLPYVHDHARYEILKDINIQCDFRAMMRYAIAHRVQLNRLASIAKQEIRSDLALRDSEPPVGVTFQCESFDAFFRDAQPLFKEHLAQIGEDADGAHGKNIPLMRALDEHGSMQIMTARSNGRMFGYLMTILSPSLESETINTAIHATFFASREFPGLGLKLQRAALQALKERGVNEVFFRAGPRGSGPKMGALYRRLGAVEDGSLYRLTIGNK